MKRVSNVENASLEGEIKRTFFTQMKSVNDQEWISNTCITALRENRVPKLSVLNGMVWTEKPTELNLFTLEERLVSLRIPSMQIREIPRGRQYSVKGYVVNVPVDIQPTINSLPRILDEKYNNTCEVKKNFLSNVLTIMKMFVQQRS